MLLLVLRLATLIGLCIAGYLLYFALSGQAAPGCGEGQGGCGKVLSSRWSKVLGLPVSIFATGSYLVVLAASIHAGPRNPQNHRDGAWRIIGFVGLAAGVSALWFIGLQLVHLGELCWYCMAAHGCSLVIAAISFVRARGRLPKFGVVPAAALIALQLFITPPAPTIDNTTPRIANLDPHDFPTLGDPDAPHAMALLFDYNCGFCRQAHRMAADAVERYDGRLVCIMLPTALDPACNRHVKRANPHSATSCELARLALAVWIAAPDRFAEFDAELINHADAFSGPDRTPGRYLNEARVIAERYVEAEPLDRALADPRIAELLNKNANLYDAAEIQGRRGVPRLVIAEHVLFGPPDADGLIQLLERAYPGLATNDSDEQ